MNPENFLESLDFLLDSLIEWAEAIRSPLDTANRIISTAGNDTNVFKGATKLWLTAFIISTVIQIPIFQLHEISWGDFGFYLSSGLVLLLIVLAYCGSIYGGLRAFGIEILFVDLYLLYIVLIGIFSPLISILSYPTTINFISTLDRLKEEGVNFTSAIIEMYSITQLGTSSVVLEVYLSLSALLVTIFLYSMLSYLVNILSVELGASKTSIMNALTMGFVVFGLIPSMLLTILKYFAIFSFL